jgi:hypothetical protein
MEILRNFDMKDGRLGLLEWSEPVIFDRLRDAYRRRIADERAGWTLARLHCRVWRVLIAGEMDKFERLRAELVVALAQHGLNLDSLAEADAQTMAELVEIVIARFQRSQRIAKGYHLALMDLARRLTLAGRAA